MGKEASRERPGRWAGEDLGRRARSRWKWRRMGLASHCGLPSSAVLAGLPGLAGLERLLMQVLKMREAGAGGGKPMATKALNSQIQDKGGKRPPL